MCALCIFKQTSYDGFFLFFCFYYSIKPQSHKVMWVERKDRQTSWSHSVTAEERKNWILKNPGRVEDEKKKKRSTSQIEIMAGCFWPEIACRRSTIAGNSLPKLNQNTTHLRFESSQTTNKTWFITVFSSILSWDQYIGAAMIFPDVTLCMSVGLSAIFCAGRVNVIWLPVSEFYWMPTLHLSSVPTDKCKSHQSKYLRYNTEQWPTVERHIWHTHFRS